MKKKLITKQFGHSSSAIDDNCPICQTMRELSLKGEEVDISDLSKDEREKLDTAFAEAQLLQQDRQLEIINVKVRYGKKLRRITGKKKEIIQVEKGLPFEFFLNIIFQEYPEIQERFPPGTLGFAVNKRPPSEFIPLKNGDVVEFVGY